MFTVIFTLMNPHKHSACLVHWKFLRDFSFLTSIRWENWFCITVALGHWQHSPTYFITARFYKLAPFVEFASWLVVCHKVTGLSLIRVSVSWALFKSHVHSTPNIWLWGKCPRNTKNSECVQTWNNLFLSFVCKSIVCRRPPRKLGYTLDTLSAHPVLLHHTYLSYYSYIQLLRADILTPTV